MIYLQDYMRVHNGLGTFYDPYSAMDCSTNSSNSSPAPNFNIMHIEESKLDSLEKSIAFLREQHERMLKGLHDEIEHLRKANKALQFRLVMCCCSTGSGPSKHVESTCSLSVSDLKNEVTELRRMLEEERSKNALLTQQMENIQSGRQTITEVPKPATPQSARKSTRDQEYGNVRVSDSSLYERRRTSTPNRKRESHRKDHRTVEISETDKITHPRQLHRGSTTSRIHSPDLNPESSSSAILLTPRTSINPPDGFWVRPSVASLQNKLLPLSSIGPRDSGARSTRITPVKLPVIRNSASMSQLDPDEGVNPTLVADAITQENSNRTCVVRRTNTEFSRIGADLSVRRSLRYNSTAVCDPLRELPAASPREEVHRSTEFLGDNLGPFLPVLTKSGDSRHAERARWARELRRKRTNQAQNYYPS